MNEIFAPRGDGVGFFELRNPDRRWPTLSGATMASFVLDGDALHVRFRDGSSGEASLRFHRIRFVAVEREADAFYDCFASDLGPGLQFVGRPKELGAWPLLYAKNDLEIVALFKGADGSLIINRRIDHIFLTVFLLGSQAYTKSSTWWRYPSFESKR